VELDHDVHRRADGDPRAVAGLGVRIERPDLHGRGPVGQQILGEPAGVRQERLQVLVRSAGLAVADAPVIDRLHRPLTDVAVAGAGVVDRDRLAARPSEELIERQPAHLSEEIPERDVDRRVATQLDAGARVPEVPAQRGHVTLDLERILPQQVRRDRLVQVRLDGASAEERLSQPDESVVGVHRDEKEVGELLEAQGVDASDLHLGRPAAEVASPAAGNVCLIKGTASPA
jgi:hypothetical protein